MIELARDTHNDVDRLNTDILAQTADSIEHLSIWRNRAFLFVFASTSLSVLGSTFHSIALNLWILQTTGSARLMSAVVIIHLIINMLFGSFAGTIADRVNRKKLMLASDIIRFVLISLIALLIYLPNTSYMYIIILTGIVAFVGTFRSPAFQASLVEIVGKNQLTQAVGAISISDNIVRISGFALGGIAVALFGGAFAIAIDAATFLLSALALLFAGPFLFQRTKSSIKPTTSFREDLAEGIRYVWRDSFARASIFLLPVVMLFFLSTFMLIQVMAIQVWHAKSIVFGIIEACIPLGFVIGSIIIMRLDKRLKRRGWWILGSMLLMGPLFIIISQVANAYVALPFIFLVGFLFSFSTTIIYIMLRVAIEPDIQGRVFGLLGALTSVAPPVGLALFSTLSDYYGPSPIILMSGIIMIIITSIASYRMRTFRNFN